MFYGLFGKKKNYLDSEFVKLLICPITGKNLRYDPKANELIQDEEGIIYSIEERIPNLKPSNARFLKSKK